MPSRPTPPTPPRPARTTLLARLRAWGRGDTPDRLLARLESAIAGEPGDSATRLHAAELHVRAGNPRRAEALLREVQRQPARTDAHELRASNRLVDLYLGPLGEPASALRELRRIADAHAGTPLGDGARDAMRRLDPVV
jgi:hypothetical protein